MALIQGVNVEAVGNARGWHEQLPDGRLGEEFLGIWVEVRYQQTLKIRIMAKMVMGKEGAAMVLVPPTGFGMSEELNHKVCVVARDAIVRQISAIERKQMIDRNLRLLEPKKPS